MNYFERRKEINRQSNMLMAVFMLIVFITTLAATVSVTFIVLLFGFEDISAYIFLGIAVFTAGAIFSATAYRYADLKRGGYRVAMYVGAKEIEDSGGSYLIRRYRNIVEEMSIAAGVPVPQLFVLERSDAINAFVSGYSPSDAAITVTKGALEKLNRNEFQGLVAHEFGHILNGDMRLNVQLIAYTFGLQSLIIISTNLLRYGSIDYDDGSPIIEGSHGQSMPVLFIALPVAIPFFCIGIFGYMLSRLLKACVSRRREFLADTCAVRFTRDRDGVLGALKKIAGLPDEKFKTAKEKLVSHMMFNTFASNTIFATHPSLVERIKALDPRVSSKELNKLKRQYAERIPNGAAEDAMLGFAQDIDEMGQCDSKVTINLDDLTVKLDIKTVTQEIGRINGEDNAIVHMLIGDIPDKLIRAAHNQYAVLPVILSLFYSRSVPTQVKQAGYIRKEYGSKFAELVASCHELSHRLHRSQFLALFQIALPALRKHSPQDLEKVSQVAKYMTAIDDEMSLFEYCMTRLLEMQIQVIQDPVQYSCCGSLPVQAVKDELESLLKALVTIGAQNSKDAQIAFKSASAHLYPEKECQYEELNDYKDSLDAVWPVLIKLSPEAQQRLIESIVIAISHDGSINTGELEVLRTICMTINCPVPFAMNYA